MLGERRCLSVMCWSSDGEEVVGWDSSELLRCHPPAPFSFKGKPCCFCVSWNYVPSDPSPAPAQFAADSSQAFMRIGRLLVNSIICAIAPAPMPTDSIPSNLMKGLPQKVHGLMNHAPALLTLASIMSSSMNSSYSSFSPYVFRYLTSLLFQPSLSFSNI